MSYKLGTRSLQSLSGVHPDFVVAAQDAWAVYRQGLLDALQQAGFPINVNWPVKPSE